MTIGGNSRMNPRPPGQVPSLTLDGSPANPCPTASECESQCLARCMLPGRVELLGAGVSGAARRPAVDVREHVLN